jgi:antitoxin ParD1/3/4
LKFNRKIDNLCHAPKLILKEQLMATMNVSLPDQMKDWVEQQSAEGRYANASDYVRDLIRKDRERADKIAAMQRFVTEGLESGSGTRSREQILRDALGSDHG